ncbi:hypothetical protein [Pseudonocardia sp. N23]|uniref:hypothetical protein n=1 Tax=Pseudonocardia sp. N23 TaxID=1987376 RepID=UPI000BFDCF7F|nr:hypothetical protein [Pseudonocardia sp. N23]GAY07411.1 hypothetical protein TOK_3319 [Pseudonocardia sp. N23]
MFVRRIAAVTVGAGALALSSTGLAHADETVPAAPVAGAVPVQVLHFAPAVPVPDPTLGLGTVLPPVFDLVGGLG